MFIFSFYYRFISILALVNNNNIRTATILFIISDERRLLRLLNDTLKITAIAIHIIYTNYTYYIYAVYGRRIEA